MARLSMIIIIWDVFIDFDKKEWYNKHEFGKSPKYIFKAVK